MPVDRRKAPAHRTRHPAARLAKKYERPLMTSPENIRVKVFIEPLGVVERGL